MDVERTIEFIVEAQARYESQLAGAEDRFNRRMEGLAKVVKIGMRMLARNQRQIGELAAAQKETDARIKELAESQQATQQSLKAFLDGLQKGRNGHS